MGPNVATASMGGSTFGPAVARIQNSSVTPALNSEGSNLTTATSSSAASVAGSAIGATMKSTVVSGIN